MTPEQTRHELDKMAESADGNELLIGRAIKSYSDGHPDGGLVRHVDNVCRSFINILESLRSRLDK